MSIDKLWVYNPERLPHFLNKLRVKPYVRVFTTELLKEELIPLKDYHRFWILFRELGFFDHKGVSSYRFRAFVNPSTSIQALREGIEKSYFDLIIKHPDAPEEQRDKIKEYVDEITGDDVSYQEIDSITDTFIYLVYFLRYNHRIVSGGDSFMDRENILLDIIMKYGDPVEKKAVEDIYQRSRNTELK